MLLRLPGLDRFTALGVLLLCSLYGSAQTTRLTLGKPATVSLAPGQGATFDFALGAQDFVTYDVDPSGLPVTAYVYDPAGGKLRGEKMKIKGTHGFAAGAAGVYRLQLTAVQSNDIPGLAPSTNPMPVTVTVTRIIPLVKRLAMLAARVTPESPRIKALTASIDAGHSSAVVEAFWHEMAVAGTPLIEPIPGDDHRMLVTFLWRGAPGLKSVFVDTAMARNAPDDFGMQRLRETDIWYVSVPIARSKRLTYRLIPNAPYIGPPQERTPDVDSMFSIMADATGEVDLLNRKRTWKDPDNVEAEKYSGKSIVEMPGAPARPWLEKNDATPKGRVERLSFSSALGVLVKAKIYMPAGYNKAAKPYPVVFLTDGQMYEDELGLPNTLDNLIAGQRIPPLVAVMIDNNAGDRLHDLACNAHFIDLINGELVTRVRVIYNVSSDPKQTVIGGDSLGGLTAGCAAMRHPETFGNVLAQSGAFWWAPATPGLSAIDHPGVDLEPNWLARQFLAGPHLNTRFYLSAGSDEVDVSGRGFDTTLTSRNLRDVLLAKGYPVSYEEIVGDHDVLNWQTTLPDGLVFLLGNNNGKK
jgi:enterochelin esterase family protein